MTEIQAVSQYAQGDCRGARRPARAHEVAVRIPGQIGGGRLILFSPILLLSSLGSLIPEGRSFSPKDVTATARRHFDFSPLDALRLRIMKTLSKELPV